MKRSVLHCALVAGIFTSYCTDAQTNPAPVNLTAADYSFSAWPATAAAGSFPPGIAFHTSNQAAPGLITAALSDNWHCSYNLESRPRFLGLGDDGIAFLNTGSAQYDNCLDGANTQNTYIGGVVLALNTTGIDSATLEYDTQLLGVSDGTIPRQYALRLQYRQNTTSAFQDVIPVQEITSAGHTTGFAQHGYLKLPATLLNKPAAQFRWLYYDKNVSNADGTRPKFRLDNIKVTKGVAVPPPVGIRQITGAENKILVYPNPADKDGSLHFTETISGAVYDLSGRTLLSFHNKQHIGLSGLVPGTYIIRTLDGTAIRFSIK